MDMEIYCDESRQDLLSRNKETIEDHDRYTCIGGIWIYKEKRNEIKNKIKQLKEKHSTFGEIKWRNVAPSKIDFYKELIDLFFEYNNEIRFRCVVVDSLKVDLDKWHNSDAELGFYKFYYQLLFHWISKANNYYIFTDYKVNRKNNRIIELKEIINRANHSNPIKVIEPIESKESLILQLEDVLMGAVGYKYNFGESGKSEAKSFIVRYIEELLEAEIISTSRTNIKFNIFEIDLKNRR